jgi:hypothetical protein
MVRHRCATEEETSSMTVRCANCRTVLEDDGDAANREPCHVCGHTERLYEETLTATVRIRPPLLVKAKSPGERKPFMEEKSGDDLHRKTGRWSKLTRLIDRRGDRYVENIVDEETGEILADVTDGETGDVRHARFRGHSGTLAHARGG